MAGAVIQASAVFLAAFSVRACPPGAEPGDAQSLPFFAEPLYAWYQDRLIFVEEFSDYREYQEQVPISITQTVEKAVNQNDI